jgi:hypothetical protein
MKRPNNNSIPVIEHRFFPERMGPHKGFAQEIETSISKVGILLAIVIATSLIFGFYQFVKFVALIVAWQ